MHQYVCDVKYTVMFAKSSLNKWWIYEQICNWIIYHFIYTFSWL